MSQWYLNKNGQALGPLEEDKVISLIESGDLSAVDLIYEAGASEWLPISQVGTFAPHFKKSQEQEPEPKPQNPESQETKDWVLLKKIQTEKGKEYKQIGPFSHQEVMELLDSGKVRFTDFAWKKGMESWAKIGEMDNFSELLPSSPEVDMSLYEKTTTDREPIEQTVVDEEVRASMTELVNIETFEHEKTQVMTPEELSQLSPKIAENHDPNATRVQAETEKTDLIANDVDFTDVATVTVQTNAPINNNTFVTDPEIDEQSNSKISLWSLEPPSANVTTEELSITKESDDAKSKKKVKKKKKSGKKDKFANFPPLAFNKRKKKKATENQISIVDRLSEVDPETWLWVAAIGTVMVSVMFFYMSFQSSNAPEVIYDENSPYESAMENSETKNLAQEKIENLPSKMQEYREQMQDPVVAQPTTPPSPPVENLPPPPEEVKKPVFNDSLAARLKAEENRKQQEREMQRLREKQLSKERELASQREAKKKKRLQEQAEKMSRSKKKKTVRKSRPSSQRVSRPSGGRKAKSYYQHRDRKALFYSSLKAETLAVEIQREFRKLKGNKTAWRNFYGQWRKKVQASLASEIKNYPKRSEVYAYPDYFKNFKKDYQMFYRYGERFNVQVVGGRLPSDTPGDMQKVFSKHKERAKSLGI